MTSTYDQQPDVQADQQADQDSPQNAVESYAPRELAKQLAQLQPGQVPQLESLLRQYPQQMQYTLSVAASRVGNATVQRALQRYHADADNHAVLDRELQAGLEGGAPAATQQASTEQAPAPDQQAEPEGGHSAAWKKSAEHFNGTHGHHVIEFNIATNSIAVRDGSLDVEEVAKWQAEHGLSADGKVGPATAAAAKKDSKAKPAEESQATPTEEQPVEIDDMQRQRAETAYLEAE